MANQRVVVDGNDITRYISKLKWSINDIDAPNSGRDMTGTMRRARVAVKAKLQFTCRTMTRAELLWLNGVIGPETVSVSYIDPSQGQRTGTFYGSSVDSGLWQSGGGETVWEAPTFSLVEV